MAKVTKALAEGFGRGELYSLLVAIKTDLEEIKSKYEDHRHSVAGAASTGTAPSTEAIEAAATASVIDLSISSIVIEKGLGMGFTGKLWTVLKAISDDFDEIKSKYEDHRHSAVGDDATGTGPSTGAKAAATTKSLLTITNEPKKQMAEGFGQGELYEYLLQIKTDLEEFKAKYEAHRHSVAGAASTGTGPSTAAGAAGATKSEITLTVE
ncbi:MAG: hypothetical protein WDA47_04990 [Bacilli bacterium]